MTWRDASATSTAPWRPRRSKLSRWSAAVDVLVPIPCAAHQIQSGEGAGRALPASDLVGDARLDNGFFVVELGVTLDVQTCSIEPSERIFGDVKMTRKANIRPNEVREEREATLSNPEFVQPGEGELNPHRQHDQPHEARDHVTCSPALAGFSGDS